MSNQFYLSISILSCLSKIFEKIIYLRLFSFFDKHKVLSPNQDDFRFRFNNTQAITDIVTTTYENMNNNLHTGLIFLDLERSFNILSHKIQGVSKVSIHFQF